MTSERPGASALSSFRSSFDGEVILPRDREYDSARAVWNGMVDRRPALVVRPTSVPDVQAAVRFAREQDLVVAVRSGGHSIPGHSTCDGGVVVDLSRMRGATVDPRRRVARVDGGALLAELDDAAQAVGLVCPVGVVSHTGVAGLTLGGGIGRLQRAFGLTIDNLLAVELVTADGGTVRASEDENADLFWGLRGAGANFGIATAFEFGLHPFDGWVTHGSFTYPGERAVEVAAGYRDLVESSPDELFLAFDVGRASADDAPEVAGRPTVWVGVHHSGTPARAERDLAPLGSLGPPIAGAVERKRYLDVQHASDEFLGWGRRFYTKAGLVSSLPDATVEPWPSIVEAAAGDFSIGAWPWGGAISRVGDEDTAFTGRTARFMVSVEAVWDDPSDDEAIVRQTRSAYEPIRPYEALGAYVNTEVEPGEAAVRSVYGDRKYERLVALKRGWDPDNVFRLNQNVVP